MRVLEVRPIEQLVRRRDTRFQFGFANEARDLVPDREEYVLAASHRGLHVLATNEDGLAAPVGVLRQVYGADLEVEPPVVRPFEAGQPVMQVRISIETPQLEAVKAALLARGANPSEEYVWPNHCILRYEAPLADLLGLPTELAQITAGRARHWIVLGHYVPLTPGPGGWAA